mgnify:CR=1 FL=1
MIWPFLTHLLFILSKWFYYWLRYHCFSSYFEASLLSLIFVFLISCKFVVTIIVLLIGLFYLYRHFLTLWLELNDGILTIIQVVITHNFLIINCCLFGFMAITLLFIRSFTHAFIMNFEHFIISVIDEIFITFYGHFNFPQYFLKILAFLNSHFGQYQQNSTF